jgi:hypothetical protein
MQQESETDVSAVLESARRYYRAMVAADEAELRHLFDSRAPIMGHFEGEFQWLDLDTFIEETKGLIGQHGEERYAIESIRIDGSIANVAVAGQYAGLWIVDHLTFVAIDGAWKITAKSFHVAQ